MGVFDFESKSVLLNSGYSMPINGLGTYSLLDDTCVESVKTTLKDGVRLIDTAYMYKNEAEVGQAIRESMEELGIQREDIFVITKLYPGEQYERYARQGVLRTNVANDRLGNETVRYIVILQWL